MSWDAGRPHERTVLEPGASLQPLLGAGCQVEHGAGSRAVPDSSLVPRFVPAGDAGSEDEAGAEEAAVGHRSLSRGGTEHRLCAPGRPGVQWQWDPWWCRAAGMLGQGWQSWEMGPNSIVVSCTA